MKNYNKLETRFDRIGKLLQANEILSWDEQVNMPAEAGYSRAQVIAETQLVANELLLADEIPDLIQLAKMEDLDSWQKANVNLMEKKLTQAIAIPADLNQAWILAVMKSKQKWRELRSHNDWTGFRPFLDNVIKLSRERGEAFADKFNLGTYDALLKIAQDGITGDQIATIFGGIKQWLPELIKTCVDSQPPLVKTLGNYSISEQKRLCIQVMSDIGFNFNNGRLDVSHHPFCGGVPSDVRITTRYAQDDFTKSLMATIHETGHALYEQNLPRKWEFQPVGHHLGMSVHEGQSLLIEMQIGRSPEFLSYLAPKIQNTFGINESFNTPNLIKLYHKVAPGLIRVEADEVTYPAHVMLRYEIEKDLMHNKIGINDIPELWSLKMQEYLGINTDGNYKDGCLQDMHWPSGFFGYFPSYTLGSIIAAQLFAAIRKDVTNIEGHISTCNLTEIKDWLIKHIWSRASVVLPNQLLLDATGHELNSHDYKKHLFTRYNVSI